MRLPIPRSFRQQIVALTATVTAFAMLLLALVLQLVLAGQTQRDVDRVLEDRAEAVISSIAADPGALSVPDARLDAGVAVYDATGRLVAGSAPASLGSTYTRLSQEATTARHTVGDYARVQATPFVTRGGVQGVVIVTENLQPYEEAERLALIVSLVTGVLTTVVASGIAAWATSRALRPVTAMADTAADWSEHDLARRFDLGPPGNELSALGATLDSLLEKVSAAIRSEQRLTSELAHELRTPLTAIQGSADLLLMRGELSPGAREDVAEIAAASRRMAATITTLLELARNEATLVETSRASLADVMSDVLADLDTGEASAPTISVDVADTRVAAPHAVAVRALAPLVSNALRHAATEVRVSSVVRAGYVEVVVEDDGPGVDIDRAHAIFEPGVTGGDGAGLGLAIARRMACGVGGDVVLEPTDTGRTASSRFVVRLPIT